MGLINPGKRFNPFSMRSSTGRAAHTYLDGDSFHKIPPCIIETADADNAEYYAENINQLLSRTSSHSGNPGP